MANVMRTKRGKVYNANDFLPPQWKVKRRTKPQTLEQAGILLIGTIPPWMNRE